jgi:ATP-dependent helicase/nuclease subunit B
MQKRRERIDAFENFCIAYGMQGKKWTNEERWTYRKYRSLDGVKASVTDEEMEFEEQINQDRALLVEPVQQFISKLKNSKNTKEMCTALYEFAEEIQLPEKLQRLRDEAEEQGRLLESKDHEQVWKGFVNLLDECVELIGDEKISRKTFFELFQTGFQSLQFANVPPSLDQVSVSNFDHSRLQHVKCAYVIGVNEGVIPSKVREDGLLGDEARSILIQNGIEVAPTSTYQLFAENFNMYVGLTRASEKLTITFPMTNDDGKALAPSSLIARFKGLFPTVQQRFESGDISLRTQEEQLSFVTNKEMALSNLVLQAQSWLVQEERVNMDLWWTVYNVLIKDDEWNEKLLRALGSITYENLASSLGEELSSELYGEELQGSVSRIELFHQCAYAHFARFGLQLQERDVYKFEAFDMGQLFHSALTVIGEALMREKKSWSNLTQNECEQLAHEVIEEIAPKFQRDILHSTNRYRFLKKKMQTVISKVSYILSKQEEAGKFRPIALEVGFGKNQELSSYELPIGRNKKMVLGGRIDRIDEAVGENGEYLRIIDYKSREKALKLSDVYYGLALQLLTYLDIAITNSQTLTGQKADPAGVLYFHVQNPVVELGNKVDESDAGDELFKKFKMNGLLLGERESNVLMDRTLEIDGGSSTIVPVAIKKDGNYTKSSKVIDQKQYPLMSTFIKQKFIEAGDQILAGEVTANPYQQKDHVPCKYCSYQSVCQFDKTIKGNEYRILPPLNDNDALQKMIEEVAKDE